MEIVVAFCLESSSMTLISSPFAGSPSTGTIHGNGSPGCLKAVAGALSPKEYVMLACSVDAGAVCLTTRKPCCPASRASVQTSPLARSSASVIAACSCSYASSPSREMYVGSRRAVKTPSSGISMGFPRKSAHLAFSGSASLTSLSFCSVQRTRYATSFCPKTPILRFESSVPSRLSYCRTLSTALATWLMAGIRSIGTPSCHIP